MLLFIEYVSPVVITNLELHTTKFIENVSHVVADVSPGDLVVTLSSRLYRVSCHVIERYHVL